MPEGRRQPRRSRSGTEEAEIIFLRLLRTAVCQIEIEVRQHDHDEEQDVRHCGTVACLVELDSLPVDIDRDGFRRRTGAALGKQEYDIEELEGLDRAEQERQHQEPANI